MPIHTPRTGLYLKPLTRPDTGSTSNSLRAAALQSLGLQQGTNSVDLQAGCLSARSSPKGAAGKATEVYTPRVPQKRFDGGWGTYRPSVYNDRKPVPNGPLAQSPADREFHELLQLIGFKCQEKFSKARDAFRFVDGDGDGSISRTEMQFFFRFFNIVPEKADKFFDRIDERKEDSVGILEFLRHLWPYVNPGNEQGPWQLTAAEKEGPPPLLGLRSNEAKMHHLLSGGDLPAELRSARIKVAQRLEFKHKDLAKAFLELDTDNDGLITKRDVQRLFQSFGEMSAADHFFELIDQDASGGISFHEFATIFDKDLEGMRLRL